MLYDTARLRSGYTLQDSLSFAKRIEHMLRLSSGVPVDEPVEAEPELPEEEDAAEEAAEEADEATEEGAEASEEHHEDEEHHDEL